MHISTNKGFPFNTVLSLNLLIDYWENAIRSGSVPAFANSLLDALDKAPELKNPIEDFALLEKHRDLINFLMTAVISPATHEQELIAATIPFEFKSFYATSAFNKNLSFDLIEKTAIVNIPGKDIRTGKIIHACLLILKQFYNVDITLDKPILFTMRNPETGLNKVYKVEIGQQFSEIICKKPAPKQIDHKIIKFLTEKVYDIDLWLQYISPEDFEFHGFMTFRMVDVTEQEMLSAIKYDLLEKNAVTKPESFAAIQDKFRSIFGIPELKLGLAYFDPNGNIILNNSEEKESWKSFIDNRLEVQCDYNGSIYERSWMEKRYVTIEDLQAYPFKGKIEEQLIANGIKNILLAPLVDDGETIGMLELATSTPGKLNPISANKVENALPMFTAAVKRVREEMATEVRAIIQEECTNIHPAVQWRFFEAGNNLLSKRRRGEKAALEDIVFKDVYPLFGLADVRNSSLERATAIQQDLQQNLKMARELLHKINGYKKLPLLEEVIYKAELHLEKINTGLASGDESSVLEFLKQEINPLVEHFENDKDLEKLITRYRNNLDPVFGVVYKRRKAFEESLMLINKTISSYLDEAQRTAQQMFPHYFEKYQTDGIEFTLYLGSSLTKDRKFDNFYLKNFRLWQILLMCEIHKKINQLKPRLKNNLEITQLILVHDQPLSIRFRPDEKQFDVDGAYDIRYEIVKKRIDKAYVKGTGERLTQPGKIAVVFNQSKIEEEYRRYFEHLTSKNIIAKEIEYLELEELPGANGLKALRITITQPATNTAAHKDDFLHELEVTLSVH